MKVRGDDLFETPLDQSEIDFENAGGETYICGNPPYAGKGKKSASDLADMDGVFGRYNVNHGYIDYVAAWIVRALEFSQKTETACAFVTTNSICQGHQVPLLWPIILNSGYSVSFAHTSFKWSNLAAHNAGVIVVIVGLAKVAGVTRRLFSQSENEEFQAREVANINAYLVSGPNILVEKSSKPINGLNRMDLGNMPYDGGNLLLSSEERIRLSLPAPVQKKLIRKIVGSKEFISSLERFCLWIEDSNLAEAESYPVLRSRIDAVRTMRAGSSDKGGQAMAARAHQMREMKASNDHTIVMPRTSSENRPYLPAGLVDAKCVVSSEAFAVFDGPLWQLALLVSRTHLVWIATVCGKMKNDFRYSNVLGWNTFPLPKLTEQNKADLTRCAENILLAREAHFPATIADLYDPEGMPENLRRAHEENDEVLERIYIGRRFRNDTERLEKLFELYSKMTGKKAAA